MSEYTQLLIPSELGFCPSPNLIAEFLQGIVDLGVVGERPAVDFTPIKRVTSQVRRDRNPLRGEVIELRTPSRWPSGWQTLSSVKEIASVGQNILEYDAQISAT